MDDLYQAEILHHYKHPQNYGKLNKPDITITETNSSCGDSATFYIKLTTNKQSIKDISFTNEGCAISTASASILTDFVKGKSLTQMKKINKQKMQDLLGIEVGASRDKCLMLALTALHKLDSSKTK